MSLAVLDMVATLAFEAQEEQRPPAAFGTNICDRLSKQQGKDIPAAKVYITLKRLEGYQLVRSQVVQRRRIYELTFDGEKALAAGIERNGSWAEQQGLLSWLRNKFQPPLPDGQSG